MALFLNNMRIFHTLSDTFVSNMFPEKGDEISLLIASDELLDKAILRYDDYSGLSSDSQMSYLGFRDSHTSSSLKKTAESRITRKGVLRIVHLITRQDSRYFHP